MFGFSPWVARNVLLKELVSSSSSAKKDLQSNSNSEVPYLVGYIVLAVNCSGTTMISRSSEVKKAVDPRPQKPTAQLRTGLNSRRSGLCARHAGHGCYHRVLPFTFRLNAYHRTNNTVLIARSITTHFTFTTCAREPEVFIHHLALCQLKSTRKAGTKGRTKQELDDITGSGQAWLIQLWT